MMKLVTCAPRAYPTKAIGKIKELMVRRAV